MPAEAPLTTLRVARLNARISAYLIDSAVLLGFIFIFFIIAGLILLLNSDLGKHDAPDSAYYAFMAVLLGGTIIGWTLFNVALIAWRGQTVGKYIIGIRTVSEAGLTLGPGRAFLRWIALHPLLFHPLLLPVWAAFALLATFVTLSQVVLVITLALLLLWIVSPAVALATVLLDPSRRALHDRLAGTVVVHLDRP
jgi:uncharacterized RDD family membrane protein YckC